MINLLLGAPGAGKSYEAVVFHVLPALMRGRKIITNLPLHLEAFAAIDASFPDLIEIRERTVAEPPAQEQAAPRGPRNFARPFSTRAFANPEDFASEWRHAEGFGPLYVVDECHFAMPRAGTQIAVEEWFSMHRHYNADVLLITQSSGKVSKAIVDLVQVCYKVRKAVALGKPDGYIRKVLDGVNGGEVAVSERKYQSQYFGLWRSHTQGMAVAEVKADDVAPFLVKFKRFSRAFYAVTACVCVWAFWPSDKPEKPVKPAAVPVHVVTKPGEIQPARFVDPAPVETKAPANIDSQAKPMNGQTAGPPPVDPNETPDPYGSKGLHLTGRMSMGSRTLYSFAVSASGTRIADTTSDELTRAGYKWEPLAECMGVLRWKGVAKAITCDAPAIPQGSKQEPVVIAVPKGSTSPIASSDGKI
jgi:zona occludens toxin